MTRTLYESESNALHALYCAGDDGLPIEFTGAMLGGEPVATWIRLVSYGYVRGSNEKLRLTKLGEAAYLRCDFPMMKHEDIRAGVA